VPVTKDLKASSQSISCTAVILTVEVGNDNHSFASHGHHVEDDILGFEQQLCSFL